MSLHLYNSLTRKTELFKPLDQSYIGMYVCGPTVYDRAHLGNARPVVVFDTLYRLLKSIYPKVTYVRNITDVDDKINAASKKQGISIKELTQKTTAAYHEDMGALNALPPDHEPRATDYIPQMISIIQKLIEYGHAYKAQDHVLFKVKSCEKYGHLSRHNQDELLAGARVDLAPYKQAAGDFVLWKPSTEDLPGWDSPWGRGRPGWHIECSAMSAHYLGQTFDVHGGGIDLIFPHHENEIAQSCCAHQTQRMANYWLHNGHLTVNGEKMSKSLDNFFTVNDILKDYPGEAIRLALLMTHYRQPLDWTTENIIQAKQTLDRWYNVIRDINSFNDCPSNDSPVIKALENDLNTPLAIHHLHQIADAYFQENDFKKKEYAIQLKQNATLLGLLQLTSEEWFQSLPLNLTIEKIELLIEQRLIARQNRDFQQADDIRKKLMEMGIQLEDKAEKTVWRRM